MYSPFSVDFRDEDHRPYPAFTGGRHRAPEPVEPPVWAVEEHTRFLERVPGEQTLRIDYPVRLPSGDLLRPLPARAEGAALAAEASRPMKPRSVLLGQLLRVLRGRP